MPITSYRQLRKRIARYYRQVGVLAVGECYRLSAIRFTAVNVGAMSRPGPCGNLVGGVNTSHQQFR